MRSGLLAVGVILLVLGAIFYFVPTPASAETNTQSVRTETYAGLGNKTNDTNSTWSGTQSRTTVSDTTADERVTVADTTSNDQVGDEQIGNPDSVVYIYLDDNGDMYSESGAFLGEGVGTAATTTVADTYGTDRETTGTSGSATGNNTTSDTTASDTTASSWTGRADAGTTGEDRVNTADTTTTETVRSGTTAGTTGTEDDVIFDDQATAENDDALSQDEDAVAETTAFGDNDSNNTAGSTLLGDDERGAAGGATGSGWIRTLAVLAMVLGAILAILGLILPSRDRYDDRVDTRARTTAPAGRRVRYEREEEREVRK